MSLMIETAPLLRMEPWEVEAMTESLPPWDPSMDDDPAWLVPVHAAGLQQVHGVSSHSGHRRRGVAVRVSDLKLCNQPWIRLDALAHYLGRNRHRPFDPEPWFGNDNPLVLDLGPRSSAEGAALVVLDGVHRSAAAKILGERHLIVDLITTTPAEGGTP